MIRRCQDPTVSNQQPSPVRPKRPIPNWGKYSKPIHRYVGVGDLTKQLNTGVQVLAITYFDKRAKRALPGNAGLILFGDISNIGNKLRFQNQRPTNYDVVGRRFEVGFRARY